jgi:hypothetical protein
MGSLSKAPEYPIQYLASVADIDSFGQRQPLYCPLFGPVALKSELDSCSPHSLQNLAIQHSTHSTNYQQCASFLPQVVTENIY